MAKPPFYIGGEIGGKSTCILAHVPMDGSFNDIYMAESANKYKEWVALQKVYDEETEFSYIREEGVIRYPANKEDLVYSNANYVMWVNNKDVSNRRKVWYAYITGLEYVNPNVTNIHVSIDVFSMYIYDMGMKLGTQMVSRITFKGDTPFAYLEPEEIAGGCSNRIYNEIKKVETIGNSSLYDITTVLVVKVINDILDTQELTTVRGLVLPYSLYVIPSGNPGYLKDVFRALKWQWSSILDAYTIPSFILADFLAWGYDGKPVSDENWGANHLIEQIESEYIPKTADQDISGGSNLIKFTNRRHGYYIPRNNKLFTYPFTCLEVSNGSGASMEYAYEGFNDQRPTFEVRSDILAPVTLNIRATGYMEQGGTIQERDCRFHNEEIKMIDYPELGYTVEGGAGAKAAFAAVAAGLSIVPGIGPLASSGVSAIGSAVGYAQKAYTDDNLMKQNEGNNYIPKDPEYLPKDKKYSEKMGRAYFKKGIEELGKAGKKTLVGAGASLLAYGAAATNYSKYIGTGVRANQNWSSIVDKRAGIYFARKSIPGEVAEQIDNYFSLYGYAYNKLYDIDLVRNKRTYFNYYQLNECTIKGTIMPEIFKSKFEQIFNDGVRIWYDPIRIGDFSASVLDANKGS